ncbi:MAG: sulfatase-like hydrolase/transferase [Chloroflexi bacterium]|nr:sulfatase-like hydrolase/transferase [Chloroflexota bacterium]
MRPSVCLITLDSWRFDALEGAPAHRGMDRFDVRGALRTPNLDRIARDGVFFTQALSCAPHTTVSHASLMTGLIPPHHGIRSFFYERLPDHVETLAEALRATGYATITLRESEQPEHPGILQANGVLRGFDAVANTLHDFVDLCRQAQRRAQPVFAFLHLWDLHAPYLYTPRAGSSGSLRALEAKAEALATACHIAPPAALTEGDLSRFRERVALAVPDVHERIRTLFEWYVEGVSWFDREQWPLIEDALRSGGLWDNAVVFLFGDHGERVHPEGTGADVFGHGWTVMDEVLRVPLLMRGAPGVAPRVVERQVSLTDVAPTVAALAGIDIDRHFPLWQTMPYAGRNLLPLAQGAAPAEPHIHIAEVWRSQEPAPAGQLSRQAPYLRCARSETRKLVRHDGQVFLPRYRKELSVIELGRQRWARLTEQPSSASYLFWNDLNQDPDELRPARIGPHSPGPAELAAALERAYRGAIQGPAIVLERPVNEDPVVERLRALGYIDD